MKYTITYEYDVKMEPHFFAKAIVNSSITGTIFRGGNTWQEARERMIETLTKLQILHEAPSPEEIEIP